MVYMSKKKGFRDFVKSRNNIIYLILGLLFLVLIAVAYIIYTTLITPEMPEETEPTTEATSATEETETETDNFIEAAGNFRLVINLADHVVIVYPWDEFNQEYQTEPVRIMTCGISSAIEASIDPVKATDSYSLRMLWDVAEDEFYRYSVGFTDELVFHSSLYKERNNRVSLDVEDYSKIGSTSDSNGITLLLADAKWIYENISFDSEIMIVDESQNTEYSLANEYISIPENYTYDPTEISEDNPFCPIEIASFEMPEKITIKGKTSVDTLLKYAKVVDADGNSLSQYLILKFEGYYNLNKVGTYYFNLSIADLFGNSYSQRVKLKLRQDGNLIDDQTTEAESTTEETSVEETTSAIEETTKKQEETTKKERRTKEDATSKTSETENTETTIESVSVETKDDTTKDTTVETATDSSEENNSEESNEGRIYETTNSPEE